MANFIKSAYSYTDWINDSKTEFCFIGRSNVGKSSLINAMANEQIAVTSKTPGRTQLVNFFNFDTFRLVDLPGYGFANRSKEKRNDIREIIDNYLAKRVNLFGIFQVVDAGVITNDDKTMSVFFEKKFVNHYIIVNKIDKLSKNELIKSKTEISSYLNVKPGQLIFVSAKQKEGIGHIFNIINGIIKKVG